MSVNLSSINSRLKRLSNDVALVSESVTSVFGIEQIATRTSTLGNKGVGEVLGGFVALTSEFDEDALNIPGFAGSNLAVTGPQLENTLSELVPATPSAEDQAAADAMEGDLNGNGAATVASLREIVTLGTPEAINFTGKALTGRTTEGMREVLQDVAAPGTNINTVISGIGNLDVNQLTSATSLIAGINKTGLTTIAGQIPSLSGSLVDDLIVNLDQVAWNKINSLVGDTILTSKISQSVLSSLVGKDIDTATNTIRALNPNLTSNEISNALAAIEVRPEKLLNTGASAIVSNVTIGRTPVGSYVDTAEEFEADLSFSPRSITLAIWHTSSKQGSSNITGKDVGTDYHYIIEVTGRVVRGMSVATKSQFKGGSSAINFYVMPETSRPSTIVSADQQKTISELNIAMDRVIPGALQRSYAEQIQNENDTDATVTPAQLPFRPAGVAASIGRRSAGNTGDGLTPGAQ